MKRVLITGANSYIGTSFENYLKRWPDRYQVDTLDMIDGSWKRKNFAGYDAVFHVAGIAHIKETRKNAPLYYRVNRDLAVETAKKAKEEGVKQFVFLSSMSVYGKETGVVSKETQPCPKTNYGKSKLEAENAILALADRGCRVAVLRPPMVYGKGCKGNFATLLRIVRKLPLFPDIDNRRSMLYIDNLCEFARLIIENQDAGIFFPQNKDYGSTRELAKLIAAAYGKNVKLTRAFNLPLKLAGRFSHTLNKAFGSLVYVAELSAYRENYQVADFESSVMAAAGAGSAQ